MSVRHDIERNRFVMKHGELPILKTADMIADGKWFSWKLCKKRMRGVDRRDGMRLLRQSAKARVDRLKAIGNAQVPDVVRLAWQILSSK